MCLTFVLIDLIYGYGDDTWSKPINQRANISTLFNPVAISGMPPTMRERKRVNYCFKSSGEINETLKALRQLKRSLLAFNRLFNHTQLELCVVVFFCWFFSLPTRTLPVSTLVTQLSLAVVFHWWKALFKNGFPLKTITTRNHHNFSDNFGHCKQNALLPKNWIIIPYFFFSIYTDNHGGKKGPFLFLSALCPYGLVRPSLTSTSYFKWSVFWEKTGFHTYCQSFSLLIPPYLYFQLYLFFCCISFWCGDIDANTMCLFISLSRAWKTAYSRKLKQPSHRSVKLKSPETTAMVLKVELD